MNTTSKQQIESFIKALDVDINPQEIENLDFADNSEYAQLIETPLHSKMGREWLYQNSVEFTRFNVTLPLNVNSTSEKTTDLVDQTLDVVGEFLTQTEDCVDLMALRSPVRFNSITADFDQVINQSFSSVDELISAVKQQPSAGIYNIWIGKNNKIGLRWLY